MSVLPPPYKIVDDGKSAFSIEVNGVDGAPEPSAEERELANLINSRLQWLRECPEFEDQERTDFVSELREIAWQGLATKERRDAEGALKSFNAQFDIPNAIPESVDPKKIKIRYDLASDAIKIDLPSDYAKFSDEQLDLFSQLKRQERLARAIVDKCGLGVSESARRKKEITERFVQNAKLGIAKIEPDFRAARDAINNVMEDIVAEYGQRVCSRYLADLAKAYGVVSVAAILLCVIVFLSSSYIRPTVPDLAIQPQKMVCFGFALTSLFFGALLSSAIRLKLQSAEVLASIFSNMLHSFIRGLLLFGFGILSILILDQKIIVFSLGVGGEGGFTTENVLNDPVIAILTGAMLGIGEATLPNAIVERSAGLMAALTAK